MGLVTVRLYEREAVVEVIRRLLDAASAGRGGTVFVVGTAGLGKTSVLQAAVAQAQGQFDIRMGGGRGGGRGAAGLCGAAPARVRCPVPCCFGAEDREAVV